MIENAFQDPLILVLGLFVVGVGVSHVLFRNHAFGRAIVRVVFLVILTVALLYAGIIPYRPLEPTGSPLRDVTHALLKIAWWLWAAWFLVGLVRALVIIERRPHESRLVQDLLAGLVYLTALFAIVAYVLNLPVQGLLATSGVIAIILGLALQSTLGDVFSGVVLSFSRPYRPGDWVSIEGGTEGRVIEINWRATHILTAKRDLAIVPNSTIGKSKIVNASSPSGVHGVTVNIQVEPGAIVSIATDFIRRAILNCRLIVETPAPTVALKAINAACIEFEVTFFVAELGSSTAAQNELLDLIYRHLAAAGIELAVPPNQSYQPTGGLTSVPRTQAERLLDRIPVFASLTAAERSEIATKMKLRCYDIDQIVLEPETVLQSFFIIASGVVSVKRDDDDLGEELARLGPADHYGEIGILAGDPSGARLNALTPLSVYELAGDELTRIVTTHIEVSQAFTRVVAFRQEAVKQPELVESGNDAHAHGFRGWLSDWIRHRYGMVAAK